MVRAGAVRGDGAVAATVQTGHLQVVLIQGEHLRLGAAALREDGRDAEIEVAASIEDARERGEEALPPHLLYVVC